MKIQKIEATYFMSLGENNVLRLDNRGLVFVEGENLDDPTTDSNGAGKSAMFEALVWGLYGKTIRPVDADGVRNEKTPKGCGTYVIVELEDDRGRGFRIERYRGHQLYKNKVKLLSGTHQQGTAHAVYSDLSKQDNKETDALIVDVLKMDYTTFVNTVFFGQGLTARFASMTDKEKKDVLEKVIGLEAYSKARKRAADALKELQSDRTTLQNEEASLDRLIQRATETYKTAKTFSASWKEKHDDEIAELQKDYDESLKVAPSLTRVLKDLHDVDEEIAKTKMDLGLAKEAEKVNATAATLAAKAHAVQESKFDQLVEAIRRLSSPVVAGKVCPTCYCVPTPNQLTNALTHLNLQRDHAKADLDEARGDAEQCNKNLTEAKRKVVVLENDLRRLETERTGYLVEEKAAKEHQKRLDLMLRNLEARRKEKNPYPSQVNAAVRDLKEHKAAKEALQTKLYENDTKQKLYAYWVEGFGNKGLRSLLLDSSIPVLNAAAAKFSKLLTAGNIKISFDTQSQLKSGAASDRFTVNVDNKFGGDSYEELSGGERVKVDVATALALQQLVASRSSASINIAIFDEAFIYLDDSASEAVMNLLGEEAKTKSSVFVVTHDQSLKGYFPTSILVRKKNGISTLTKA
jgi:DNA repair exonuclease SbcCD ATPase subunit